MDGDADEPAGVTSVKDGDADQPSGGPDGGSAADGEGGFGPEDLDETPLILRRPSRWEFASYYPREELKSHRQADVKVVLLVDQTGTVIDVTIVEGAGRNFDAAARKLGHLLRFTPGRRGGRPVKMRAYIVFNFQIDDL